MLCPHCQQEIANDSLICTHCGKSLKPNAPSEPRKNEDFVYQFKSETEVMLEGTKKKSLFPFAIVLCVLSFLFVLGCAFCLLTAFHIIPDFFGLIEPIESTPMLLSL